MSDRDDELRPLLRALANAGGQISRAALGAVPLVGDIGALLRAAIAQGVVYTASDETIVLTEAGQELLQRESTAPEEPDPLGGDDTTRPPFDPNKIRVETLQDPVFAVLHQIDQGTIWLQPDFQRNFVWGQARQSQLIESILLRIPLPAFYLDAERDDRLQVIDGLQRLTTLKRFCLDKTLELKGMQYLKDLEGKTFDDLPVSMQQIILHRTRLTLYIIQSDTPKDVKVEIFFRVNRGGLILTRQEIRHALYQGKATDLLKELAEDPIFLRVTTNSINPLRMDDRECVLRFLAFSLFNYTSFQKDDPQAPRNLDDLLNRTMDEVNQLSDITVEQLGDVLRDSLLKAEAIFGRHAFRRFDPRYIDEEELREGNVVWRSFRRNPVSKPLFETWTVLLRPYSLEVVTERRARIIQAFLEPLSDNNFISAITLGTGSQATINYRFTRIQRLLEEVLR